MSPPSLILSLEDASRRLKLAPYLLLKCVKLQARKNGGIKLKCFDKDGDTCFYERDLDDYNSDLLKPWVDAPTDPRPSMPEYFKDYLKCEALMRCGLCDSPYAGEFAHITPWEVCHHHHPHNLILLCTACHTGYDTEARITKANVLAAKQKLMDRYLMAGNTVSDRQYPSLRSLCVRIAELLDENSLIFWTFGPKSPLAESSFEPGADRVWRKKRVDTIAPNNSQITILLADHTDLFRHDVDFVTLAEAFTIHAMSYAEFVSEVNTAHKKFFFPQAFDKRVRMEAASNGA